MNKERNEMRNKDSEKSDRKESVWLNKVEVEVSKKIKKVKENK